MERHRIDLRQSLALGSTTHTAMDHKRYSSDSEHDGHRSPKRQRRTTPPRESNGNSSTHVGVKREHGSLPPLSLSILGVEPLDEFVREVADFIHHMIMTRKEHVGSAEGNVEVEAKVGILRDKASGQRLQFPVLVETSAYVLPVRAASFLTLYASYIC